MEREEPRPPERREAHHALNNPVDEPDPTEWPDPYEKRPDPRAPDASDDGIAPHTPVGATSTSEPHPAQDPEAHLREDHKRGKVDE
jgi:hypothetical protein